jgi:hypothetical protein
MVDGGLRSPDGAWFQQPPPLLAAADEGKGHGCTRSGGRFDSQSRHGLTRNCLSVFDTRTTGASSRKNFLEGLTSPS